MEKINVSQLKFSATSPIVLCLYNFFFKSIFAIKLYCFLPSQGRPQIDKVFYASGRFVKAENCKYASNTNSYV